MVFLLCNIECKSYMLSQMEKFWACDRNKENLQLISQSFFIENASENSTCLTLNGIICDSDTWNGILCIQYKDGITSNTDNLDKPIEEADQRIISHTEDSSYRSTFKRYRRFGVNVVFFYAIFHFYWFERFVDTFGIGQNKRFIPVHKLSYKLGLHMCSNLFEAHAWTGSDTTSKIGTKAGAIKCG